MSNNSDNKEAPPESLPGTDTPAVGEGHGIIDKPSSTGETPKDSEDPESLTKVEVALLVISICVSGRQRAASVMKN